MHWLKKKYNLIKPTLLAIIFFLGPMVFVALFFDSTEASLGWLMVIWLSVGLYFAYEESERRQKIIDYFNEKHRDEYLEIEEILRKKQ